jgi:hypothetical protein
MDAMDISAIIKAVLAPQEGTTGNFLAELKPGDQLAGKVLNVEHDGRVLIDLGGRRALARIGFAVRTGQNLKLQVVDTGSILHLRAHPLQNDTKNALSPARTDFSQVLNAKDQVQFVQIAERLMADSQLFGRTGPLPKVIQNALTQIKTIFATIPMERSMEQISQWLKTAVEDRGVLFEKQMADIETDKSQSQTQTQTQGIDPIQVDEENLKISPERILITRNVKSQLIRLKHYLSQSGEQEPVFEKIDSKALSFMRRSVDRILEHIEQQQDRAIARWGEGENQQVIVHALPLPDHNKPIQLKLFYPRRENQSEDARQHRIAILLNLDPLGDVRVDLSMTDKNLQIGFFVGDAHVQQFLTRHVKRVETSLSGHFENIMINVSISKEKIDQFEKEDLSGANAGRISINV